MSDVSIRLELDYDGVGEACLRSAGVRAMIADKTDRVRSAAGPDATSVVAGVKRARGYVRVPADQESKDAVLSSALGAAR